MITQSNDRRFASVRLSGLSITKEENTFVYGLWWINWCDISYSLSNFRYIIGGEGEKKVRKDK